jgi:hypothetical protein
VITNRNEASFVVKTANENILGQGSGNIVEIKLSPSQTMEAFVEFLDIIVLDQGKSFVLKAAPSAKFTIEADKNGEKTVLGNYNPI